MNTQSDQLNELATALAAAQASLNAAKKDAVNPHFQSHYATLQSVWSAAREVLAPNGLSVIQTFDQSDGRVMHIRTTLLHKSGQWIAGVLSMAPQQANPQGIASAITYGRRYALCSILGIVAEEDDDGNAASKTDGTGHREPAPPRSATKAAPAASPDVPAGSAWRLVIVPKFIKKFAGQTLGDMPSKDVLWWANNYTPKEFRGSISETDLAFRRSLDAAKQELEVNQEDVDYS